MIEMSSKKQDLRAKFLQAYANVPESLRKDIVVIIDKKPYTWDTAYLEVKSNTPLGKKMLKNMDEMEIL